MTTTSSLIDLTKRSHDIAPLKPPVDPASLHHANLLELPDFRRIPAYADVTDEQFMDHRWQAKKSITRPDKLLDTLRGMVSDDFIRDATEGFARAPMSVRVSPYMLSLINRDGVRVVEPGEFTIMVGASSTDIRQKQTINVVE